VFFCAFNARAQNTTNLGTEFWTAYMDHNNGASTGNTSSQSSNNGNAVRDTASLMSLYITSGVNTSGTITIADSSFAPISFTVTANQVTIVTMPAVAFLGSKTLQNKGIHIVSLKPVAIYAHIYAQSVSGATLLLPVSTLGKDYFSINYTQHSNAAADNPAYSAFIIIATQDNTTVQITPTAQLVDSHSPGQPFTLSLKKGQLYQGLSANDLTGTKISSINSTTGGCTKIAVFSGSSRVDIGCNPRFVTSDNLFQQVYPTASWGKNYITTPLITRNYDTFRIILSNPSTTTDPGVLLNGQPVPLSAFGDGYYEFPSQMPNVITSAQPIQVVQYSVSEDNTINCGTFAGDIGDPEMIFLTPLEQTLSHVTLYSTGNFMIIRSFINVLMKTNAVSTFTIDGQSYTGFSPVPGNPLYSYAQIPVQSGPQDVQVSSGSQGTHNINAGDGFSAIAYGFGQAESYGYAAGTNLLNLTENITLLNPGTDSTQTNGCTGVTYKLQLTLPYQTSNIVWDFRNGTTYTDSNPKVVSTIVKGNQTLYLYQYYKPVTYTTPGDTSVVANVFNPIAGDCGDTEAVEFDFNIASPPDANFAISNFCLGDSTLFTDKTITNGNPIKSWLWNFGDNTTSAKQNPAHLYTNPGNYKVTLIVTNSNGCGSDTIQIANIVNRPLAAFSFSQVDCAGQKVVFTDNSGSSNGKITQWIWDFGDGEKDTLNNNNPFNHIYSKPGIDTVKLMVVAGGGCSSTLNSQIITITPAPVVDFTLPDVCTADAFAQFTDESTIADNSASNFTYQWDFGDPNASSSNPNISTQQNPRHKYLAAGNYNVALTVTSGNGCAVSNTKPFTVNGDMPAAALSVENSAELCSMDDVIFDDQSNVNFGNITKVVWYFDYNNNPQDTVVFLKADIPSNRKFNHNYGLFNSPLTKSYTIRMDVYSGITCVSTIQQSITLKANPLVTISQIGHLCQGDQPVQIVENKNGFTGTGIFSGTGVSATGLFDPGASGPGSFTINYIFTSQNGCSYSTSEQVIVTTNPTISLPQNITMLQGAQLKLPATAEGDNLTYQWSPATGLSESGILNPIASPADNTTYTLTVTNTQGCTAVAQINVNVLKYLVIPNAFTPNGDGINDTWDIKYLDTYPNNTVSVFNRYGETVYYSIGYATPWDGKYRGANLPPGTYYYIIDPKNGRNQISGDVTIIR